MIKEKLKPQYEQMFGEPVDDMIKAKPPFITNLMYAVMILSDAQEAINHNRGMDKLQELRDRCETARRFINKSKYFITLEMKEREDKGIRCGVRRWAGPLVQKTKLSRGGSKCQ